jgi:hypothetical protein
MVSAPLTEIAAIDATLQAMPKNTLKISVEKDHVIEQNTKILESHTSTASHYTL